MSTTKKTGGAQKWAVRKLIANLDASHSAKLDDLLNHYRNSDPRTSMSRVIELALDALHEQKISGVGIDESV